MRQVKGYKVEEAKTRTITRSYSGVIRIWSGVRE